MSLRSRGLIMAVLSVMQGQDHNVVDYTYKIGPFPIEVVLGAVIFFVVSGLLILYDRWS